MSQKLSSAAVVIGALRVKHAVVKTKVDFEINQQTTTKK